MVRCFVKECPNKYKPGAATHFHTFPKDNEQQWLYAIGRTEAKDLRSKYICSDHFAPTDYEMTLARRALKKGVVPSINLNQDLPLPTQAPLYDPLQLDSDHLFSVPIQTASSNRAQSNFEDHFDLFSPTQAPLCDPLQLDSDHSLAVPNQTANSNRAQTNFEAHIEITPCTMPSSENEFVKVEVNVDEMTKENKSQRRDDIYLDSDTTNTTTHIIENDTETIQSLKAALSSAAKRKRISVLHNYCKSPSQLTKKINDSKKIISKYKNKYKAALETSERRKRKIIKLQQVITDLKKKEILSAAAIKHLTSGLKDYYNYV